VKWADRCQGQLIAVEQQRQDNILKVERKRNTTNLACERRDDKIRQKTSVRARYRFLTLLIST